MDSIASAKLKTKKKAPELLEEIIVNILTGRKGNREKKDNVKR